MKTFFIEKLNGTAKAKRVIFKMQSLQRQNAGVQEEIQTVESAKMGLCIVALPREYRSITEIKKLVEEVLKIGKVSSIHPVQTTARTGVIYNTANVVMDYIDNVSIINSFSENEGRASVDVPAGQVMSWDNGKPMAHLSFRELTDVSRWSFCSPVKKLELDQEAWTSLHIPIIPKNMSRFNSVTSTYCTNPEEGFYDTESGLTDLIQNKLGLGQVKRIDFVVRDDKAGNPKAAFIHFDHWYDNKNANYLRDKLNESGTFRQKGYYDGFGTQRFVVQNDGEQQDAYFIFKINHKPIPDVDESTCELNIHQLVASNKRLGELVAAQTVEIEFLKSQLEKLQPSQSIEPTETLNENQENEIGEILYNHVMKFCPERAGKITGMFLELDIPELLELVNNPTGAIFQRRIDEAIDVLIEAEAEEAAEARLNR